MKILIGMTRSDTLASGSFVHIVQIGECFRKEGVDVRYVIGKKGPCFDYLTNRGFRVYSINHLERDLSPLHDLIALVKLVLIILKFRPGLCSWHTAKIGALGRIASMVTLRKNFYIPHGVPFYECAENHGYRKYRVLEKCLSYLPAKIIGVCDYDTQQYLKLGVSQKKALTICNGMKSSAEYQKKVTTDKTVFITAARFEQQKDYDTLAQAVRQVLQKTDAFELHIYGDGRREAYVRELFGEAVDKQVFFKGVVGNLASQMASTDVFILSSHWEGLPRTIIEAMACRMPIIATAVGGVGELIDHGETGYLIPPNGCAEISSAMLTYIEDRQLVTTHGLAGYHKYCAQFTLERMLENYKSVYIAQAAESVFGVAKKHRQKVPSTAKSTLESSIDV